MNHTDPQKDIPCTACEAEGSRSRLDDDGLCPDCRTPAGRLVTALAARGIKSEAYDDWTVNVGAFVVEPDDGLAADAIAAIVQALALRAERDTLAARVAELEAENARLTSQNETYAGAMLALGAL